MELETKKQPDGSTIKTIVDHFMVVDPLRRFYEGRGHEVKCEAVNKPGDFWRLTIHMRPSNDGH